MPDAHADTDFLGQAIASLKGQLEDHIEAEGLVLREMANQLTEMYQGWPELTRALPAINARLNEHERRLKKVEMNGHAPLAPDPGSAGARRDPTALARHPFRDSDLDLERYNAELTPAGGIRVEQAMWSSFVAARQDTERAIGEMRIKLEAYEADARREKTLREGAERERGRVKREAEQELRRSDAKLKRMILVLKIAGPVLAALGATAHWLWPAVAHLLQ
jgi:hypothetical protein